MSNSDPVATLIAQKNLDESSSAVQGIWDAIKEQQDKSSETYEKFHNNLALFSSGTIALSITFLGYLKSLPNRSVEHPRLLVASWIVLLICVLTSLFYSFFHSHYSYFRLWGEYLRALEKKYKTMAEAVDALEFVNLETPEAKQAQQSTLLQDAQKYGKRVSEVKRKEKRYTWLWQWCGRVSRFAFPIGLALLVLFAIKNI